MARGRKNACAVNIAAWLVEVKHPDAEAYTRVNGLTTLTQAFSAKTEDGSAETDLWAEPIIQKRSGTVELTGTPLRDEVTGQQDPGQRMLTEYANWGGCDADFDIRISDQTGHCAVLRAVVEEIEDEVDEKGKRQMSWKLAQVGEPEFPAYVQAVGIDCPETVTVSTSGADALVPVAVLPADASNKRYRVHCKDAGRVIVTQLTETAFCLRGLVAGETIVTVKTVNNGISKDIAVTVTD